MQFYSQNLARYCWILTLKTFWWKIISPHGFPGLNNTRSHQAALWVKWDLVSSEWDCLDKMWLKVADRAFQILWPLNICLFPLKTPSKSGWNDEIIPSEVLLSAKTHFQLIISKQPPINWPSCDHMGMLASLLFHMCRAGGGASLIIAPTQLCSLTGVLPASWC